MSSGFSSLPISLHSSIRTRIASLQVSDDEEKDEEEIFGLGNMWEGKFVQAMTGSNRVSHFIDVENDKNEIEDDVARGSIRELSIEKKHDSMINTPVELVAHELKSEMQSSNDFHARRQIDPKFLPYFSSEVLLQFDADEKTPTREDNINSMIEVLRDLSATKMRRKTMEVDAGKDSKILKHKSVFSIAVPDSRIIKGSNIANNEVILTSIATDHIAEKITILPKTDVLSSKNVNIVEPLNNDNLTRKVIKDARMLDIEARRKKRENSAPLHKKSI